MSTMKRRLAIQLGVISGLSLAMTACTDATKSPVPATPAASGGTVLIGGSIFTLQYPWFLGAQEGMQKWGNEHPDAKVKFQFEDSNQSIQTNIQKLEDLAAAGAKGTSLLLVERGMPGFSVGKRLKKLGLKAQDTSELFFDNVRLPADSLLGGPAHENKGFICLMQELQWERMQLAISGVAAAQAAIDWTVAYVKERKVFGQAVSTYQNTRYTLAELQTQVQIARVFVDKCIEELLQNKLDVATASMAKYWCSDLQCKVMDECVQLFGGYGYMWEYPITRAYADARPQRIYGGTNEIMKELISRSMGLSAK